MWWSGHDSGAMVALLVLWSCEFEGGHDDGLMVVMLVAGCGVMGVVV